MDDNCREVLDRLDLMEVCVRYARGIDQRDWDAVAACFVPGATVDGTRLQGPFEEYVVGLRAGVDVWGTTMHFLGNQQVTLDGDRAHVMTYAVAYHFWHQHPAEPHLTVGVIYQDDLVRTGPRHWQIGYRKTEGLWTRIGEQVLPVAVPLPPS
jgi:hypothetical protein